MTTCRAGFTLVEVLLAVLLLGVGALALVGGQVHATRLTAQGRLPTRAAAAAAARLSDESVRAATLGCAALGSGAASHPLDLEESWTATPGARSLHLVDVLTYRRLSGPGPDTVATVLPCP